jgi:hypothetical protein
MGGFLALSGVIGKRPEAVLAALKAYAESVNGGIMEDNTLHSGNDNYCVIAARDGHTTVLYPRYYSEWDDSSSYISKALQTTVFSLHIHDGDLWMYLLYHAGELVDQFNPIPDYWDADMSESEIRSWSGNADAIVQYVPYIRRNDINNYLVRWDLDEKNPPKAYPTDENGREDWQLTDFMNKLKLPYPLDDDGNALGQTYKLWTKELELKPAKKEFAQTKPWWKFW